MEQKPVENFVEASVGTGCCKSGVISGHLSVDRRGFAIGQSVPFTVNIDNKTTNIFNARIILSQVRLYRCLSLYRSLYPSICLSVCLSIYLFVDLSDYVLRVNVLV